MSRSDKAEDPRASSGGGTRRDKGEKRLGKGLGALLGDYLEPAAASGAGSGGAAPAVPAGDDALSPARMIALHEITPNEFQPRRGFSEEELADLTASLKQNGLLQPIVVRPLPAGLAARWELVAGERRWRAATRLGWKTIPAVVREVDDRTMLVLALVENLQRQQLSALEEAEAYQRLADEFSLSQQQIADVMGRDRSTVANTVRLLQLPATVRTLLAEGRLSAGHARALLGAGDARQIAELARRTVEEGWSVRQVEAAVKVKLGSGSGSGGVSGRGSEKRRAGAGARDANERDLEEALQRALGTEVRIRTGRGMRGRIEVPFYGAEDFERLFEILAGRSTLDVVS
jgi:ParB family chromosome partitioning protein